MKAKFAVMLAPALALGVLADSVEAQQHRAIRLGNPSTRFAQRLPRKPDDVRVLMRSEGLKKDVAAVLKEAGWPGDLEDLDRAAATAEITEVEVAPGTRLPFMASRVRGRARTPHALMDVLWAGPRPIRAFAFEMSSKCVRYRVVVPRDCGNFWLEELGKDETGECAPPPPPPVVSVTTAGEACVTQPVEITVNVQNPPADGKVTVAVAGQELMTGTLSAGTFKATFPGAKEPGNYEVRATSGGVSNTGSFQVRPCVPSCGITVSPNPPTAGQPMTVDVTGSRVAAGVAGGIRSARIEILREGEVVDSFELTAPQLSRDDVVIKRGGLHTIRAVVTDEAGQASSNACEVQVDVRRGGLPLLGGVPVFLGGYFGKERLVHEHGNGTTAASSLASKPGFVGAACTEHAGFAVAIQPQLGDAAELEAAVGVKINFGDEGHTSLFGDLALNGLFGRGFVGGGLSFWDLTSDDTRFVGLLVQAGVDLTSDGKWQLVGQARAPFNEFDDLDNNYQVWGGLRLRPFSSK